MKTLKLYLNQYFVMTPNMNTQYLHLQNRPLGHTLLFSQLRTPLQERNITTNANIQLNWGVKASTQLRGSRKITSYCMQSK